MTEPATTIAQGDLRCAACAGQCVFDPASGCLTCQSCGQAHFITPDPSTDPAVELHYDPDLPHTEQPRFTDDRPYQCETCGGEVVFQGASMSENCPYCNGGLVEVGQDESYAILGMIPFAVPQETAQILALGWVGNRWAAPNDLPDQVAQSRVAGLYVPFWTFDSHEAVEYTVTYSAKNGKNTISRLVRGFMKTKFDDLLMPASPHVTPLIRDGILHEFRPENLRPFEPAYLAGFAAERHHQSVRAGLAANAPDKALLLRNRIKQHSGKSRITGVVYKTDTTGIRYRRILLPVWILHYDYGGQAYKVVSCGLQGRTFGERPFSRAKLLGISAAISAAVTAFGFIWGAAGMY